MWKKEKQKEELNFQNNWFKKIKIIIFRPITAYFLHNVKFSFRFFPPELMKSSNHKNGIRDKIVYSL